MNPMLTIPKVQNVTLLDLNEDVNFSKEIKSVTDSYLIE
jgi:hypothetical protein